MAILPSSLFSGTWYVRSLLGQTLYRGSFEDCEHFIDRMKGQGK